MQHTLQTIPAAPYIAADFHRDGGRIGIAWSGNSRKELQLGDFLSRLDTRGFELFALQPTDILDPGIVPLSAMDFADTAKLIERMDHIVTVDTAVAHLAGAMGRAPSQHLIVPYLRDWRWWHKSAWYPSINIYPQDNPDDWTTPFACVNEAIHR